MSLAYPTGSIAGFNPSHIAAANCHFSGVAQTGGFLDLTAGLRGVAAGTPASLINGTLGPATTYTTTSDITSFANKPTTADQGYTFGCIFILTDVTANTRFLISNSNSGSGHSLAMTSGGGLNLALAANGVSTVNSGFIPTVNTPYFFAGSLWNLGATGRTANFVLTNLLTGQVKTAVGTQGTIVSATAPTPGTYTIGNRNGQALLGSISAAMGASVANIGEQLPMSALVQWAHDPWSFWYPNN